MVSAKLLWGLAASAWIASAAADLPLYPRANGTTEDSGADTLSSDGGSGERKGGDSGDRKGGDSGDRNGGGCTKTVTITKHCE